jgi:hypothetical protein
MMRAEREGEGNHHEIIVVGLPRNRDICLGILVCHIALVSKESIRPGFVRRVFRCAERGSILDDVHGDQV